MRYIKNIFCAAVGVLLAAGASCEAVPDGDDVDRLHDRVAGLPEGMLVALKMYGANRIAYGWLLSRDPFDKVGEVVCREDEDQGPSARHEVRVRDVLFCLQQYQDWSYKKCVENIGAIVEYDLKLGGDCELDTVEARYDPAKMPNEFYHGYVTVDDVVRALLGPPPPVEIQLLLVGAGGFFGAGGLLCPRGADWGCPADPLAPGGGAVGATGGGDR